MKSPTQGHTTQWRDQASKGSKSLWLLESVPWQVESPFKVRLAGLHSVAGLMDTQQRSGTCRPVTWIAPDTLLADGQVTHIRATVCIVPVVAPGEWGRHSKCSGPSGRHEGRLLEGINNTRGIPSEQWGGIKILQKRPNSKFSGFSS